MKSELPVHFQDAIKKIKRLKKIDCYSGAFIFGSAARGKVTKDSDLDVKIILADKKGCTTINHPFINSIKLDVTFSSFDQAKKFADDDIAKGERIPMIAESTILFDKTGKLQQLKKRAIKAKPKKLNHHDHTWIQYMVYHATDKAKRHLTSDPLSSLFSMDSNLEEMLKFHYQLNRRWWLSNKQLLKDIRKWDPKLNTLLEKFLLTHNVQRKFKLWKEITKHILIPMGEPKSVADINCDCQICQQHLRALSNIK